MTNFVEDPAALPPATTENMRGFESKEFISQVISPLAQRREKLTSLREEVTLTSRFLTQIERDAASNPALKQAATEYVETLKQAEQITDPSQRGELIERRNASYQLVGTHIQRNMGHYLHRVTALTEIADPQERDLARRKLQERIISSAIGYLVHVTPENRSTTQKELAEVFLTQDPQFAVLTEPFSAESRELIPPLNFDKGIDPRELTPHQRHLPPLLQKIEDQQNVVNTYLEMANLIPEYRNFIVQEWVLRRKEDLKRGIKVIPTPFYEEIIQFAQALGDMENGVGGKIYYGPPGTAKSELSIEINRREGFASRVISIHYWMSFSHLFGEALMQVGSADTRAQAQTSKVGAVSNMLDGFGQRETGSQEFWDVVQNTASKMHQLEMQKQGGRSYREVLTSFLTGLGVKEEMVVGGLGDDPEKTKQLQNEVLNRFKLDVHSRMLLIDQGILEEPQNNDAASWVAGEILLAVDQRERPVLDELDKAGPGSTDSLNAFLAWSPGQVQPLKLRGMEVKLPSWLRVDATANTMDLDEQRLQPLYNRFKQIYVGYPPPRDELMIAAVKMADADGVIQLSQLRQLQFASFFLAEVPWLRDLYRRGGLSQPFSLRNSNELHGMVVNSFEGNTDRGRSMAGTVRQLLYQQRQLYSNENQRLLLQSVVETFEPMLERPVPLEDDWDLGPTAPEFSLRSRGDVSSEDLARHAADYRAHRLSGVLGQVADSPLYQIIATLPETTGQLRGKYAEDLDKMRSPEGGLARVKLDGSPIDLEEIAQAMQQDPPRPAIEVGIDQRDMTAQYKVQTDEGTVVLLSKPLPSRTPQEVVSQSLDGNLFVTKSQSGQGSKFSVYRIGLSEEKDAEGKPGYSFKLKDCKTYGESVDAVELTPDGNMALRQEGGKLHIDILPLDKSLTIESELSGYQLSPDGTVLLVKTVDGETQLFDLTTVKNNSRLSSNQAIFRYAQPDIDLVGNSLVRRGTSPTVGLIRRE